MTNPLKRGSAPNRDHPDYERPGSFKPGHKKVGGRKRGTPNVLTADYKRAILEAAYRIGNDGNGRNGAVGYFAWIALHHPAIFLKQLLINVLALEFAQSTTPEQPRRTMEEINEWIRDYIGAWTCEPDKAGKRSGLGVTLRLDRSTLSGRDLDASRRRGS
ncbi:MAG: hypothetical protein ACLPV2_07180 [Steroidobacteraceae bacterium]